eukprot:g1190.t1
MTVIVCAVLVLTCGVGVAMVRAGEICEIEQCNKGCGEPAFTCGEINRWLEDFRSSNVERGAFLSDVSVSFVPDIQHAAAKYYAQVELALKMSELEEKESMHGKTKKGDRDVAIVVLSGASSFQDVRPAIGCAVNSNVPVSKNAEKYLKYHVERLMVRKTRKTTCSRTLELHMAFLQRLGIPGVPVWIHQEQNITFAKQDAKKLTKAIELTVRLMPWARVRIIVVGSLPWDPLVTKEWLDTLPRGTFVNSTRDLFVNETLKFDDEKTRAARMKTAVELTKRDAVVDDETEGDPSRSFPASVSMYDQRRLPFCGTGPITKTATSMLLFALLSENRKVAYSSKACGPILLARGDVVGREKTSEEGVEIESFKASRVVVVGKHDRTNVPSASSSPLSERMKFRSTGRDKHEQKVLAVVWKELPTQLALKSCSELTKCDDCVLKSTCAWCQPGGYCERFCPLDPPAEDTSKCKELSHGDDEESSRAIDDPEGRQASRAFSPFAFRNPT